MKRIRILLYCMILSGLFSGNLLSQEPAVIKIDFDRKIGAIDPNIYSGFVEPIGTTVYGNIYNPSSPLADENGFRKDIIQLLTQLKIRSLRWPGGNYVSGYNWEDGIGPKNQRPARMDLAWHQIETNQMGTDEYAKFTSLIGAQNFVCINAGTGTLDQARHWIEYCNVEEGTYYSDLRKKYGNEKPFNVKYWALGNEIDGPWQMGQKNAEDYVKFALEAAKLMQWADKNVKFIAVGASNYKPDMAWIDWDDYVLTHMAGSIDYLSVHRYVYEALPTGDRSFSSVMSLGLDLDLRIGIIRSLIQKALMKTGSKRPIYISFDEWAGGGNNLTGSLQLAQHLNAFVRNADIVKMANITMLTSLVGISPDGDYKNALFYPFYLFSNNCNGTSLNVSVNCEKYSNKIFNDIPYLDVTAALNDSTKTLVVNIVNRHETKDIQSNIVLQTGDFTGSATANEVNGKTITSGNTKTEETVGIKTRDVKFKGNNIQYTFPAHSFTQLVIPLK